MQNCKHNVYDSLHKRYLKETPQPQPDKIDRVLLNKIIVDLASKIRQRIEEFDADGFLLRKKGRLRTRYTGAYTRMQRGYNLNRNSNIAAFVKNERYFEAGKAPRMIMGRDPRFNVLYAQIVEPIEKAFFSLPQVANACDFKECGDKFSNLVGEWFMENDMSKFEGSQRYFTLEMEHLVYSLALPEKSDLLDVLFAYKIRKKGTTQTGVHFEFWECRGSGDMDTSLGNGILNYISTQYFLMKNYCPACELSSCSVPGCRTYKFVVKGDDSYACIPRFASYVNTYSYFGFDAKILLRKSVDEVEFCSGHFLEYQPGKFLFVQKLVKLIESLTTCINDEVVRNGWHAHYYKSLGLMYKRLYSGIPIYEDIADFLLATNSNLGLNLNLIPYYNILDAFQHHSGGVNNVQMPLIFTSMAMINKMDISDLNVIQSWFRSHRLCFSPELSKRCNIRSKPGVVPPIVDFEFLNSYVVTTDMPKRVSNYYKKLRKDRNRFVHSL
jgi:hypothetical protein